MKKILLILSFIFIFSTLVACQNNDQTNTFNEIFVVESLYASTILSSSQSSNSTTDVYIENSSPVSTSSFPLVTDFFSSFVDIAFLQLNLSQANSFVLNPLSSSPYANEVSFNLNNSLGDLLSYSIYLNQYSYLDASSSTGDNLLPTTTITTSNTSTTTTTTTTTVDAHAGATPYANLKIYTGYNSSFTFPDSFDDSVFYSFEGALVINGSITYLEGKELYDGTQNVYLVTAYLDQNNYVSVRYLPDSDGVQKYFFEVYADGVLLESSNISFVWNDIQLEISLDVLSDNTLYAYQFQINSGETFAQTSVTYQAEDESSVENGQFLIILNQDSSLSYYLTIESVTLLSTEATTTNTTTTSTTTNTSTHDDDDDDHDEDEEDEEDDD